MATSTSVDSSLWWDPFSLLLTELENVSLSSAQLPPELMKKLDDNRAWFLDSVSLFKKPNEKSRVALDSPQVKVGSHTLSIQPELKVKALKFSSYLHLDEVQSYILAERTTEHENVVSSSPFQELLHVVLLEYYIERQCLLKCTRRILLHALYVGNGSKKGYICDKALRLVNDGLESKLISVLQSLMSSAHPDQMDVDLFTLWAEETLTEDNLILDILFITYYESFVRCNGERWRELCLLYKGIISGSYNIEMLAISTAAIHSSCQVKVRLLLILMETLDIESLLQMVHDQTTFRQGASVFSSSDFQEMDTIVSSLNGFEIKEAGPLLLTWAVFLCLISSLPGKEEHNVLPEIDHVGYVRQAFDSAAFNYFLDILHSDLLKESEGLIVGYRSVLRTFVSAFIASYEINLQVEDTTFRSILDILCNIYRGEESLCTQFWDKESFIDGPIRCLLCDLEGEFPFRVVEFVRFLSSLCEGAWPSECVFNFLDKSVGISSLFEINNSALVDHIPEIVETQQPLLVPGMEGLLIPYKTRGHVLKVVGGNTVLVRWEYKLSGMLTLLMRLAQGIYLNNNEQVVILDLLSRMVSFNMAVCFALMGATHFSNPQVADVSHPAEKNMWVVEVICILVRNLSPNSSNAAAMSMGLNILSKIMKCFPATVTPVALKANIFSVAGRDGLSESWLQFGKLAKMLLIDFEHNDSGSPLSISLLDFTMQLVETGLENDAILALIAFCLQYILVNHEYWKYKVKHTRWIVTLKVLEVMRRCILLSSDTGKLGPVVHNMLLSDASIHSTLFRVVCTTRHALEKLYVSRLYEPREIEGLENAICSVLDILFIMLSAFSKDSSAASAVFHQALTSLKTKPIPIAAAVISLLSYFRNVRVQIGAARVLSMLLLITEDLQPHLSSACFNLDDEQIADLRQSIECIFLKKSVWDEDLFVAVVNMLTSAALYQPSFLVALLASKENLNVQPNFSGGVNHQTKESLLGSSGMEKSSLIDALLQYLKEANNHAKSNLRIQLNVLNFMKALWQTAGPFIMILDRIKMSEKFLEQLTDGVSHFVSEEACAAKNITEMKALNSAYKFLSLSSMVEIMSYDIFLQKKLLHAESIVKQQSGSKDKATVSVGNENSKSSASLSDVKNMLSSACNGALLGKLTKLLASCEYDNETYYRAKVASSLFTVHVMSKLATGDGGSLSVSLVGKIHDMLKKLISLPAFAELSTQYLQRGYSGGDEMNSLILSDLYYHLQGELEGRKIGSGAFRELSLYLIESEMFQSYQHNYEDDIFVTTKDACLFNLVHIQADLGLDLWDYSEWKESKTIAARMLSCMQDVNSMMMVTRSKLTALKALTTILTVIADDTLEKEASIKKKNTDHLVRYCIADVCRYLQVTIESLAFALGASDCVLGFLAAQSELLTLLIRSADKTVPLSVCALILKTSGSGLKQLSSIQPVAGAHKTIKLLLKLLLSSVEYHDLNSCSDGESNPEYVKDFAECSNVMLGLLPILCSFITNAEHCTLALTTLDLILRKFLSSETWLSVLQKHLQLQHLFLKLQDENNISSIPILMKFFLTLARVRGGAIMLITSGLLSYLQLLFTQCTDDKTCLQFNYNRNNLTSDDRAQNYHQLIWKLGLAVITGIVQSLGDGSYLDVFDNVITYFFSEKVFMISYHLNAPDFSPDEHDKKRSRTQRTRTSLSALRDTEQTLMLMCVLARHRNAWAKATKEIDSQLREKCIHMLAFVSRVTHRHGESPAKVAPFICPPNLKEEFDYCTKPSFIRSKSGWFALSPLACESKPEFTAPSTTSLIVSGRTTEITDSVCPTYFSDTLALRIYTITFLLLKFLCLQAEGAAQKAEDVGYVDLAHFPELPMPEILHGLQDQAMAIICDLCDLNKSKHIDTEVQNFCCLMLRIMEMTLYLELCVVQICGIRPVLGRVEDFSKEVKLLLKGVEGHAFLKQSVKSLKQILSFVYPGLLQSENF
ncbi:uncharacterized protein LOC111015501 isoform X2 [Momordica charantia]|uniref:Uncharacterized protein LOC111015501 isoform X2 n=1 Tax=Momordica charantia TaxID=3673 RepID=A0A6J1CY20_MOMCH|nr:uncharacterized protein LOC111015501 isoform X2 [Momordica charantia]